MMWIGTNNYDAYYQINKINRSVSENLENDTRRGITCGREIANNHLHIDFVGVLALPQYQAKTEEMANRAEEIGKKVVQLTEEINEQTKIVQEKNENMDAAREKKASFGEIAARILGAVGLGLVYTALAVSLVGLFVLIPLEINSSPLQKLMCGEEVVKARKELKAASSRLESLQSQLVWKNRDLERAEKNMETMEKAIIEKTKDAKYLLQALEILEDTALVGKDKTSGKEDIVNIRLNTTYNDLVLSYRETQEIVGECLGTN